MTITSTKPNGAVLDTIPSVTVEPVTCPPDFAPALTCRATPLGFAVADVIDRSRAAESARWIQAEVGGRLVLSSDGRKIASVRVGGPRVTAVGPIERLRGHLRVHVFRTARGGMPAIGGDDAGARALARNEVDVASLLWGRAAFISGRPPGKRSRSTIRRRSTYSPSVATPACPPAAASSVFPWLDGACASRRVQARHPSKWRRQSCARSLRRA